MRSRCSAASLPKETHRLRGRVGYLGHEPLLYRDLSPRENLELAAALHGLDGGGRAADRRLLEAVGMAPGRTTASPSSRAGMKQRVDICRAVLHEPELLLLDEPDAHLDTEARRLVAPLIARREWPHARRGQPRPGGGDRRTPTSCLELG